jgi:hypothetical protein
MYRLIRSNKKIYIVSILSILDELEKSYVLRAVVTVLGQVLGFCKVYQSDYT